MRKSTSVPALTEPSNGSPPVLAPCRNVAAATDVQARALKENFGGRLAFD